MSTRTGYMAAGVRSVCRNCGDTVRLAFVADDGSEVWDHPLSEHHTVCGWWDGIGPTDRVASPTYFEVRYATGSGAYEREVVGTSMTEPRVVDGPGAGLPAGRWWMMTDETDRQWAVKSDQLVSYRVGRDATR